MDYKIGLRAIRDCGVIRAKHNDRRFSPLVDLGLAVADRFAPAIAGQIGKSDFRLNKDGRARAARVLKNKHGK